MKRRSTGIFSHITGCLFFTIAFHVVYSQPSAAVAIPVSDSIVLAAGAVRITEYEVRKNYWRFQQEYKSRHGDLPKEATKEWVSAFIDRTYLLADARDKGYFEQSGVNRSVESMAQLIIGQTGGLLEQRLFAEQPAITEAELQQALDKSRKQVYVEYLKFADYDQALDAMGGLQPEGISIFRKAVDKSRNNSSIVHKYDTFSWPSMQLGFHEDYITELAKGALTPVLTLPDGYYVIHVQNTGMAATPGMQRRNSIRNMLIMRQKEKATQAYLRAVKKEAGTVINPEALQALEKKLPPQGALHTFDRNTYHELLPLLAFTYNRSKKKVQVTMETFMEYYNSLPLKKEIGSMEAVVAYMHAYVLNDFNYRKAEALGITRELQFMLDKENYKKTVVENLYETNELKAGIGVSDHEIGDRYEMRKQHLVQAAEAIVSILVFDTRHHAMEARFARDITRLKGILRTELHRLVKYNETSLPDTVRKMIFNMPVGERSRPVPVNGQYVVIVKESESGQRVPLLTEVKDKLSKEIMEEKLKVKKQQQVELLKKKYRLEGRVEGLLTE